MSGDNKILKQTEKWLRHIVIGLNFCPFAKAPFAHQQIRFSVSRAKYKEALLTELQMELQDLQKISRQRVETTLVIVPTLFKNFYDFNNFSKETHRLLRELSLEKEFQIATFHPNYQFSGTKPSDISNFTNQSPYPIIHLLRASSVTFAVNSHPDIQSVYKNNISRIHQLGGSKISQLKKSISCK